MCFTCIVHQHRFAIEVLSTLLAWQKGGGKQCLMWSNFTVELGSVWVARLVLIFLTDVVKGDSCLTLMDIILYLLSPDLLPPFSNFANLPPQFSASNNAQCSQSVEVMDWRVDCIVCELSLQSYHKSHWWREMFFYYSPGWTILHFRNFSLARK